MASCPQFRGRRGDNKIPDSVRFWMRVDTSGVCWIWLGAKFKASNGEYGLFWVGGKKGEGYTIQAYKWAYEHLVGPIPQGMELDHTCRNPICVNPSHLEPVTHRENLRRSHNHIGMKMNQVECIRGHPLNGNNLYITPDGRRQCRICSRARDLKCRLKKESA